MNIFKKGLWLTAMCLSPVIMAQKTASDQQIFYKWYENGIAHYAITPPRVTDDYERINQYGMVVKDRPNIDSFQVIKPMRPDTDESEEEVNAREIDETLEDDGVITKKERCRIMEEELEALREKEDIYQEDEDGNLIPLSEEEVMLRIAELQSQITDVCDS